MIYQERPNFIFLCETQSNKSKMDIVAMPLGYEGCFGVEAQGQRGGLLMLWKDKKQSRNIHQSRDSDLKMLG